MKLFLAPPLIKLVRSGSYKTVIPFYDCELEGYGCTRRVKTVIALTLGKQFKLLKLEFKFLIFDSYSLGYIYEGVLMLIRIFMT